MHCGHSGQTPGRGHHQQTDPGAAKQGKRSTPPGGSAERKLVSHRVPHQAHNRLLMLQHAYQRQHVEIPQPHCSPLAVVDGCEVAPRGRHGQCAHPHRRVGLVGCWHHRRHLHGADASYHISMYAAHDMHMSCAQQIAACWAYPLLAAQAWLLNSVKRASKG